MLTTIWNEFLSLVSKEAGSRVVETWLKAVALCRWDAREKVVYLQAPNNFVQQWICQYYLPLIQNHLSRLLHVDAIKIIFVGQEEKEVGSSLPTTVIPAQKIDTHGAIIQSPSGQLVKKRFSKSKCELNKNYLFDTFIKGPHNTMAFAAAQAVTERLGNLYNPLFIYGKSGLGKTHLLHAIANEVQQKHRDIHIVYQPAERFVHEFIQAIRFDKMLKFQAKYKDIDVFLVDDVQSISNKHQTQEALFHIFNTMYDAHKQIIFSSDSYPTDINGLADRLRSRMAWGLVADIQAPPFETKVAIVKHKAELYKSELSDEVAAFIASQPTANVRELEGLLVRVMAFASLAHNTIDLELAKKAIERPGMRVSSKNNTMDTVVKPVLKHYRYTLADLRSEKRSKQLSNARQVAMYCMKKYTTKSLHEIALYFGRNDHTTVLHACKQIQKRMHSDQELQQHLDRIDAALKHV